jgi:hypothetical protein
MRRASLASLFAIPAFLTALTCGDLARAEQSREIWDRAKLKAGVLLAGTSTDLAVGDTLGTLVNIESVLGYDKDETIFGLSGFYRFHAKGKGRHSLSFSYSDLRRDSAGIVEGSFPIDDVEFVGAFVSKYNQKILRLNYRLSLSRSEKSEGGLSFGVSGFDYDFAIAGEVDTDDDGLPDEFADERADFLAPLPTVGFFYRHAFRPNLLFDVGTQALDLEIGDYEGRVLELGGAVSWYFTRHMGLEFGLGVTDVQVKETGDGTKFSVDYEFSFLSAAIVGVF